MTLGTYNANSEYFPITFEATLNGESQRYERRLTINRDDARSLYNNWDRVIKTGYLSIDPGYRPALAWIGLEYTPIWQRGFWWVLNEVYDLGDNNLAVAFSPDGNHLAIGNDDGRAILWNLSTGKEIQLIIEQDPTKSRDVTAVAFSPDGKYLAIGSVYAEGYYGNWSKTTLLEVNSGRIVWRVEHGIGNAVLVASCSPDGNYLATINRSRYYSTGQTVAIWALSNGQMVRQMSHSGSVHTLAFSPDGRYLATGSRKHRYYGRGAVNIWELSKGTVIRQMEQNRDVYAVAYSPNEKYLATGSEDGKVTIWEVRNGENIQQMEHKGEINAVAFSPDGNYLAAGGEDRTITFYRIPTNITLTTRVTKDREILVSNEVTDLAWNPDGRFISDSKKVYRVVPRPDIQED